MKKKKSRKGKGKPAKSKQDDLVASQPDLAHGIIPSVDPTSAPPSSSSSGAQPTPSNDQASSSTISPLPDLESSLRGRDEINKHNAPPQQYQAPSYADVVKKGNQPQKALQPPMQPQLPKQSEEIRNYFPEDQDGSSSNYFSEDRDGCSPDSSSEDDDGSNGFSSLDAAQQILADAVCGKDEVSKIKEICQPHLGKIKSIWKLTEFLKRHRPARHVKIFRGKMTILLATAQGRLLSQAMVAVIWECHLQKRSWNGTFDSDHIRIIKPRESKAFMMILKDPVRFEGEALLLAMANDLDKAAAILKSLYMDGDDYAVYFEEFIQNLKEAIKFLVLNERAFMEYLSYHPSIMPSTGRSTFVSKLSNIRIGPVMQSTSQAYQFDWKTIVESEIKGKIKAKDINRDKQKKDTDIISVLYTVYTHNPTNCYDRTVSGLIRFMRNVLEHGKEHDDRVKHGYELELYLAKMFSVFLPITLRTMLMSERMELYEEDWSSYKISKCNEWEPAWSD